MLARKPRMLVTARQIAEHMLAVNGVSGIAPKAVRDLAASVLAIAAAGYEVGSPAYTTASASSGTSK